VAQITSNKSGAKYHLPIFEIQLTDIQIINQLVYLLEAITVNDVQTTTLNWKQFELPFKNKIFRRQFNRVKFEAI